MKVSLVRVSAIAVFVSAGCSGSIEPGDSPRAADQPRSPEPGSATPAPSGGGAAPPPAAGASAGELPLRALTRLEYVNTVRDLLGLDPAALVDLPVDLRGLHGYPETQTGSESAVDRYVESAQRLAAAAMGQAAKLLPCAPEAATEACAQELIRSFGRRAFRRPLDAEQAAAFLGFYRQLAADPTVRPPERFRLLIEAFLASPEFLYRGPRPGGARPGVVALDGWELASRLSYALWASMPDDELLQAAETGGLASPAGVERQARRLMSSARAQPALVSFIEHWAELEDLSRVEKDAKTFPLFSEPLRKAMHDELEAFVRKTLFEGDGKLSSLLTASHSFGDAGLAKLYGATAPVAGRITLNDKQRAGLFTQAAFLNVHASKIDSHPIKRGKVVFSQLLCGEMPPPPPEIPAAKPPAANVTTRERYAEHGNAACARACHELLDPLGFAFETYDAIGAYRTTEAGKPIDATGQVRLAGGVKRFGNAVEMLGQLAASDEVRQCVARQFLRFALGRKETAADAPSVAEVDGAFASSGGDVRELMVAAVKSAAFTHAEVSR